MLDVLTSGRSTPVPILDGVTDFSAGDSMGAAVVAGRVWTWGGQPDFNGGPNFKERSTPRVVPGLADIQSVSTGGGHTLALDGEGEVWVWGSDEYGQLGLGTAGSETQAPTSLSSANPALPVFVEVEAGSTSSFAVDVDGHVWSWGMPLPYSPVNETRPVEVAGAENVTDVSVGGNHVLARTSAGEVLAWGSNFFGELGQGDLAPRAGVVTVPGLSNVVDMDAGHDHNYAVLADGTVESWGGGVTSPETVPNLPAVAAVASSQYHQVAVGQDGVAYTWGLGSPALGRTFQQGVADPVPAPVDDDLPRLLDAGAAFFATFLLDENGTLYSLGSADKGVLGDTSGRTLAPVLVDAAADAVQLSAGENHVLGLNASGDVIGWGSNEQGQLGAGPQEIVSAPRTIGLSGTVTRVLAGWDSSYALDDTGVIWAWGRNNQGQLGDGTLVSRPTPAPVDLPHPVVDLDAGAPSTIALDDQGQVWAWGGNSSGELGTGDEDARLEPVPVTLGAPVIDVAMGEEHAAALGADGTVWAWGWNNRGQIGGTPNVPNQQPSPREVLGLPTTLESITAGDAQTIALENDGTVWEWGRVLPNRTGSGTPTAVSGLPPMAQVSASGYVRIGLSRDGEVWVWGENTQGDLATGDTAPVAAPRRLAGFSDASSVLVSKDDRNNTVFVLASPARTTSSDLAAGDTVRTGAAPSYQDPADLAVTSPVAGPVSIAEDPGLTPPPGLSVLGTPFDVTAPAATAAEPLVLTFSLHRSAIPDGTDLAAVTPLRDGVVVGDCAAGSGSTATPDPCVASRSRDALGTVEIVVRTSHASTWALVEHAGPPPMPPLVDVSGIAPGDVLTLNETVPVSVTCQDRGISVTSCAAPTTADTSTVGEHTLVATATDATGAVTSIEVAYEVRYDFSGFHGTVVSAPGVNTGKAGRTYPLGWALFDAHGDHQSDLSAIEAKVRSASCGQFDLSTGEELDPTTSGGSGLRVQPDGTFAYNWKTPKSAGCYRLEVHLADGSSPWLAFSLR
jgi:alpha-tubulin suppressor-like RCC1 family protein